MNSTQRVAAHRERQKAEGVKTVSITMTTETHQALKEARATTSKTYQTIVEEALRSPLISEDHMEFLHARADQAGEPVKDVLSGIIQGAWDELKGRLEDPLEPKDEFDPSNF
ncbi:MAG: hypothetical protein JEZ12_01970 [Desulfobacterium sp.]|nr:hypothetical protein [Desulfobacterium sp.]